MNKTHRPALILLAFLSLGIFLGRFIHVSIWVWIILSLVLGGCFWAFRHTASLYVFVVVIGAFMMAWHQLLPSDCIGFLSQAELEDIQMVEGIIDADMRQQRGKIIYDLRVEKILIGDQWRKASGVLRITCFGYQEELFEYGDRVDIKGKIRQFWDGNAGKGFSYRQYMLTQGVYGNLNVKQNGMTRVSSHQGNILKFWVFCLHRGMNEIFLRYLSSREAAFVSALVMGDRQQMSPDLKEIFVNTGTAHILAISGMNMAVITAACFFLLRLCFVSRLVHFWGTIGFLFVYAFLSGWSAAVVRACIMSAVILAAFVLEQESDSLNSLGLAGLIILLLDPMNLFDIGFQLSFTAVLGILTLFNSCKKMFFFCPRFVADSMALSLAAWVGTVGITLYHFHLLTPVSILANIPIVPMADMVMVLGLGLACSGAWSPIIAQAFAGCLKAILSAMIICAKVFSQVPYGHINF